MSTGHSITIACPNCGVEVEVRLKLGGLYIAPKSIRTTHVEGVADHACPALAPRPRRAKVEPISEEGTT